MEDIHINTERRREREGREGEERKRKGRRGEDTHTERNRNTVWSVWSVLVSLSPAPQGNWLSICPLTDLKLQFLFLSTGSLLKMLLCRMY